MRRTKLALFMAATLTGCATATAPIAPAPQAPQSFAFAPAPSTPPPAISPPLSDAAAHASDAPRAGRAPLLGAAGDSAFVLAGSSETYLGVWVDVPSSFQRVRAPADVAFVIDTSGSMAGTKILAARAAARDLVEKLSDGDIVSILTFSDVARERVPPTTLSPGARNAILGVLGELQPMGSTNMFDGLRTAERNVASSPPSHPVRRIVMISDGMANVGPSSPEALGAIAARGADTGVQVSSIGVGLDYDEHTLNALAVQSSGRLYHLTEPHELPAIIEHEVALLQNTAATNASVEVVPAPGVQILGGNSVRLDWGANGAVRIPLGTMFGGQHREMLLRVRVSASSDGDHPLASVRLRFNDPTDGNLERMEEVVARYRVTTDRAVVEQHANTMTRSIAASQEVARFTAEAAQHVNEGRFDQADTKLAAAEDKLRAAAAAASNERDRKRALDNATRISTVRAATKSTAGAPAAAAPAAKRARALEMNEATMRAAGF